MPTVVVLPTAASIFLLLCHTRYFPDEHASAHRVLGVVKVVLDGEQETFSQSHSKADPLEGGRNVCDSTHPSKRLGDRLLRVGSQVVGDGYRCGR